jgi:uncharacterized HAD superfamily protein
MLAERLRFSEISNQQKLKIVVDVDGVLDDVSLMIIKSFNKRFGTNYQLKDLDDWDATYNWAKKQGLSDKDAMTLHRSYWYESPKIHRNALSVPGAFSLMKRLSQSPLVDLNILTSRHGKEFEDVTYLHFAEDLPFIDRKIIGFDNKVEEIAEINPDICIEDSPKDAEEIIRNTKAYVIMVPYPYNYGKFKHERLLEYDKDEFNFNNLPTLWPIYRLFKKQGLFYEEDSEARKKTILEEFRTGVKEQGPSTFLNNFYLWFPGGRYTKDDDIGRLMKDKEMLFRDSDTGDAKIITYGEVADEIKNSLIKTGHAEVKAFEFAMAFLMPDGPKKKIKREEGISIFEDVWVDLRLRGYSQEFLKRLTI